MAIKIAASIGTSQGITDGAYVRIHRYVVDRNKGALELYVSIFKDEETARLLETNISNRMGAPIQERFLAKVDAIPHWHSIEMARIEEEIIDGRVYQKKVPDFSSLEGDNIFAKAYPLLKAKIAADLIERNVIQSATVLQDV
jgi:hypothetical protein